MLRLQSSLKKKDYFFPFFSYKKYVIIIECKYDCHEPNGWCDKLTGMCTCEGKNSGLDCRACIAGFKRNHKTGYCEETQKGHDGRKSFSDASRLCD